MHKRYDNVFNSNIGCYNDASGHVRAYINMGPVERPSRKARLPSYSPEKMRLLQNKMDELERLGVLARPEDINVTVEHVSPSFLIKNPDGSHQLVTAFTTIGTYAKPIVSQSTSTDDILRFLAKYKYIIKSDMTKQFFQLPMKKSSIKYLGILTPYKGLRVYTRAGMPGSTEHLDELMSRVLGDLMEQGIVKKIADDLYTGGNTIAELLHNWEQILHAFEWNNLRISASKTVICPITTTILGWIWSAGQIRPSTHKVTPLATSQPPSTIKGLRSWIGAFKHLKLCIPRYSALLSALETATGGKESRSKVDWSENLTDFGELIEQTSNLSGKLIILGDFNIHVDSCDDAEGGQFSDLLDAFGLKQHVSGSTHVRGHTLDLVISREADDIIQSCEVGTFASDHNAITFTLRSGHSHPKRKTISARKTKSIDISNLASDIQSSELSQPLPDHVDDIVHCFDTVLRQLLDRHAPVKSFSVAQRLTQPWINDKILACKRERRECEKLWRNDKSTDNRVMYRKSCDQVKNLIKKAKEEYFVKRIEECQGDQKKLFQIVDKLLGRNKTSPLPHFTDKQIMARIFNEFFVNKISDIQSLLSTWVSTTGDMACPPLDTILASSKSKLKYFKPTTVSEISTIIQKASKASCSLDPIPTSLLCDLLPVLAPVITRLVNAALSSGTFPSRLKSAIVTPLLKKLGSDVEVLKNYRPVSNLSFISKVIEKVVASRILDHMKENNLLDPMQSAYRSGHSTETALLRVHNDIVCAIDKGHGVFLILLDYQQLLTRLTTRSFFHS